MALTPAEIAKRFDISFAAAEVRAKELARMQRQASGQLRPLPDSVVEFLLAQKRKGFAVTSVDATAINLMPRRNGSRGSE